MGDFFHLRRGDRNEFVDDGEDSKAIARERADQTFLFVDQVEELLGEGAEPDPLFFVDSWTNGVSAAVGGFTKRQSERGNSTWSAPLEDEREDFSTGSFAALSHLDREFLSSVRASFADHYVASRYKAQGQAAAQFPQRNPRDSNLSSDATVDDRDMLEPLTIEGAYRLLGVTSTSTRDQIRAAYRRLAARNHPDRLEHRSRSERRVATERMARINEAHRMLCADLFKE